jgi:dynein intermediate chain 2, axonemal
VETLRWRKKVEREVPFTTAVKDLAVIVEKCIEQNNQIDLFEEYFINEESEHLTENISTKTLMLFKY